MPDYNYILTLCSFHLFAFMFVLDSGARDEIKHGPIKSTGPAKKLNKGKFITSAK